MTTKDKDSLKKIIKNIHKDRYDETLKAQALKTASRDAVKEREDKGWARVIINPHIPKVLVEEVEEPEPKVDRKALALEKARAAKTKKEAEEKARLKKELQEAQDKLAAIEAAKEIGLDNLTEGTDFIDDTE